MPELILPCFLLPKNNNALKGVTKHRQRRCRSVIKYYKILTVPIQFGLPTGPSV